MLRGLSFYPVPPSFFYYYYYYFFYLIDSLPTNSKFLEGSYWLF